MLNFTSKSKLKLFLLTLNRSILFLMFYFITSPLYAEHIIGGVMSYKIIRPTNNDPLSNSWRYKFTLKIYRDCQGSGADFDSTPGAYQANASIYRMDQKTTPVRTLIFPLPKTTKINPNPGNDCVKIPPNVCVEEGIYELEFDLPIIDAAYVISYQRCCRNISISNILNPAQTGATFSVEISAAAQKQRLDSPEFSNFPPVVLCAGQTFDFDQSVNSTPGDSITYTLASPFTGGGPDKINFRTGGGEAPDPDLPPPYSEVQYVGPTFTVAKPLGINSLISINPQTGRIQGKTDLTGQFVLGIEVKRYRSGILLNTLRRDFQINVGICDAKVKASLPFPANPGSSDYTFRNCGDTKVTLTNNSQDTAAITSYEWSFFGATPSEIFKSTQRNPSIDFLKAGTFNGKLILNPTGTCKDSLLLKVVIPEKVKANFEIIGDSCKSNPVTINYKGTPSPKSVRWQFETQSFSIVMTSINPDFSPTKPGSYKITLSVEGEGNCRDTNIVNFPYYPLPEISKIENMPLNACVGKPIQFSTSPLITSSGYSAKWDFGDGGSSISLPTATHTFSKEGIYKVSLLLNGGNGVCLKQINLPSALNIRTGPKATFTYSPQAELTLKQILTLSSNSGNQLNHLWKSADKIIDSTLNTSFVLPDTGYIPISLNVTDPLTGCSDLFVQEVYVKPQIRIFFPSAFSPNYDGINDEFIAFGDLDILKDFKMQLFSRWGNPVFISTDPNIGWDGSVGTKNEIAPMDTYIYMISYTDNKGEKQYFSGTVLLMR
jgi:gliding motility-associated-like protein